MKSDLTIDVTMDLNIRVSNGKQKLRDYLLEGMDSGCHQFRLVPRFTVEGDLVFYLHPMNMGGKTIDFKVVGNDLETICESGTFQ